jgi:RNA polymerase sigma factor (sigma-70 family)
VTDGQLLKQYVESGAQDAFTELATRYLPLVYAAARRQVRDAGSADDVTQAVFVILARKASALAGGERPLAGWLLKATHFAARQLERHETRLKRRERTAAMLNPPHYENPEELWKELSPEIDAAIARLRPNDRDAVALRFLQSKSIEEVSAEMGITPAAAQKRLTRALERLRDVLRRRGVMARSSMLAPLLGAHGLQTPPAALKATIGAVAAGKAGAASLAISKGAILLMNGAKIKGMVAVAIVLLAVGGGSAAMWKSYSRAPATPPPRIFTAINSLVLPNQGRADGQTLPSMGYKQETQGRFASAATRDASGAIWIGTEDQGVWVLAPDQAAAGNWRHFTTDDGLGDETAYALATDTLGRVWVGHVRSGVSVYNGNTWKNYGPLNGPLGQRVFRIAVCPANATHGAGDVWIATELGLSRYSSEQDSWRYFTTAQGSPADPSCMAFDHDGNIYVGTQCHGLVIARASDDYKTWQRIVGPDEPPAMPNGNGLPNNLINDVLVTHDGTIFVATTHGLAQSVDRGANWTFRRGGDWIAKFRGAIDGPPADWTPPAGATVGEDFVQSLAEDEDGRLWVGYRMMGYQCLDEKTLAVIYQGPRKQTDDCSVILPRPGQTPLLGCRGFGIREAYGPASSPVSAPAKITTPPPMPEAAPTPSAEELAQLAAGIRSLPSNDAPVATFVSQDWDTQGDWVGRYGRQAAYWPEFERLPRPTSGYELEPFAGPHRANVPTGVYYFCNDPDAKSPKALYMPTSGKRMIGEWNDGGWQGNIFGPNFEGPDLWLKVTVPQGLTRVSIYFHNLGANGGDDRWRDYTIELRQNVGSTTDVEHAPALAMARVATAQDIAYRTFLLSGGKYWLRVRSNYSHMAGVSAVFFDRVEPRPDSHDEDDMTSRYLGGVRYDPPLVPPRSASEGDNLRAARDLWDALDAAYENSASASLQFPDRFVAYRAAAANGASPELLANWRWTLHLWTTEDRSQWENVMARSREALKTAKPEMKPDGKQ